MTFLFYGLFGFAPKLNYYVFPKLQTHEKRPQITLMLASQALRSCSRLEHALAYRSRSSSLSLPSVATCFAAALELPKVFSKSKSNAKAAATAGRECASDSDALRAEGASALSAVFSHGFRALETHSYSI